MVMDMINWWQKHYTGFGMKVGPADVIHNYHKPLLMLHGKADRYSLPEKAQLLYDKCPSEQKMIVWFEGDELVADGEVYLFDVNGRLMLHGDNRINVVGLPVGVYLVRTHQASSKIVIR